MHNNKPVNFSKEQDDPCSRNAEKIIFSGHSHRYHIVHIEGVIWLSLCYILCSHSLKENFLNTMHPVKKSIADMQTKGI